MFNRILYATDLSEKSLSILNALPGMRCTGIKEIIILRVVNLSRVLGATKGIDIPAYIKAIESESIPLIDEIAEKIREMGFQAKPVIPLPAGDPTSEIVKVADKERVDLIIMGSRGRGTFKAILLGSTAEGTIRKAKSPVIVFKDQIQRIFSKILYATDFSKDSERVGKYARFVAKSCGSDVVIAHVLERGNVLNEYKLNDIKKEFENEGIKVKTVIGSGSPPKEIVRIANIEGATCIFVGRSGKGLRILGSTADFVVRYCSIPVFIG